MSTHKRENTCTVRLWMLNSKQPVGRGLDVGAEAKDAGRSHSCTSLLARNSLAPKTVLKILLKLSKSQAFPPTTGASFMGKILAWIALRTGTASKA